MQIARSWRQQSANLRMVGSRCVTCETFEFPVSTRCKKCGGTRLEDHRFSGRGTVYSFAEVLEAPAGFIEQVPYLAGLIQLEEGPFVTAMLTDVNREDVEIGLPVGMVTRRLGADGEDGPIFYAYKFSPRWRPEHDRR